MVQIGRLDELDPLDQLHPVDQMEQMAHIVEMVNQISLFPVNNFAEMFCFKRYEKTWYTIKYLKVLMLLFWIQLNIYIKV